jgi:hypothetical protein
VNTVIEMLYLGFIIAGFLILGVWVIFLLWILISKSKAQDNHRVNPNAVDGKNSIQVNPPIKGSGPARRELPPDRIHEDYFPKYSYHVQPKPPASTSATSSEVQLRAEAKPIIFDPRQYASPQPTPSIHSLPATNTIKVTEIDATKRPLARQIQLFCESCQIKQLVHFTHIQNLSTILQHGLLSIDGLAKTPTIQYRRNDAKRLDGQLNAISLSISFPNYRMFYIYQCNIPQDWVVISLKPDILWELDCAFCSENAASNNVRFIPIAQRNGFQATRFSGFAG